MNKRIAIACLMMVSVSNCQSVKKDYLITLHTDYGNIRLVLYDETPLHKENFLKRVRNNAYDSVIFHRVIEGFMIQGGDPPRSAGTAEADTGTLSAELVPKYFHHRGALAAARQGDAVNPERKSSVSQFYIVQGRTYTEEELLIDRDKLLQGLSQLIMDPNYDTLRQAFMALEEKGDWSAYQAKIYACKPLIEQALDINVSQQMSPDRLSAYTQIGGTPHLDDTYTVFGRVVEGMEVVDTIAALPRDRADQPLTHVFMHTSMEELPQKELYARYGLNTLEE